MSGKRGMKHFGEHIIHEVQSMRETGVTYREIAEHFNLRNAEAVRNLLNRHKQKDKFLQAGIVLSPKGRPRKGTGLTIDQERTMRLNG